MQRRGGGIHETGASPSSRTGALDLAVSGEHEFECELPTLGPELRRKHRRLVRLIELLRLAGLARPDRFVRCIRQPVLHPRTGFAASYPPPGEVGGSCSGGGATCLTFPDSETLVWPAERSAGTYNLYRGLLSAIVGSGFGECSQVSLTTTTTTDTEAVPSQDGFYYLVTVVNGLGEEGTKGNRSDGGDRLNATPCP